MGVAILGDNVQAWLVAAHASASSGEAVRLLSPGWAPERVTLDVRYADHHALATIELGEALGDDDRVVIVAAPEIAQQRSALADAMERLEGRLVVLAPGGAGGSIVAAALIAAAGVPVSALAELTGFPVLGTVAGRTATITLTKRHLPIGVFDQGSREAVVAAIRSYLPDVDLAESVLATSLANTNNVVHPPLAIVNTAQIDSGIPFRFYREGLTPAGARLITAVDRERLAVTDALGLRHVSIEDWFRLFYGDQGLDGDDIGTMLGSFVPLAGSFGPTTVEHRYLVDDVGSGLAVIEAIGLQLGLPMVTTTAVCSAVSVVVGRDLRAGAGAIASATLERGRTA